MSEINISAASVRQLADDIKSSVIAIKEQTEMLKNAIDRLGQTNMDENYDNLRNYVKLSEHVLGTKTEELNSFIKTLNEVADLIDQYHASGK